MEIERVSGSEITESGAGRERSEVPGMVRTLKTLLDATIRERLRLETLLDEAGEVADRLGMLLDRADRTLEPGKSLVPEQVSRPPETTQRPGERSAESMGRLRRVSDSTAVEPETMAGPEPVAKVQMSAGQVESLKARLLTFRRESTYTVGMEETSERIPSERGSSRSERMREVERLLRQGMRVSRIAADCHIPVGEVELMSRLRSRRQHDDVAPR
ncbi:MAG: hypothetical protein Q4C47_05435 [Planctomycetia bacterium]|nr:hypothetical protein [Planctomycetia bacterium]